MDKLKLENVIENIKSRCKISKVNFIIVGSIAYRIGETYDTCDDLDCVIVYDSIDKLNSFQYINKNLLKTAKYLLDNKKIDLFATKLKIDNIKVSMDFISIDYLEKLSKSTPKGYSEFLKKLTDAEELSTNDYYNFYGEKLIYNKIKYTVNEFNVYRLPKFIYENNKFFTGVLYNKFLHNPKEEFIINKEVITLKQILIKNYAKYYKKQKQINPNIDIAKSIRNWDKFSKNSKKFIQCKFEF